MKLKLSLVALALLGFVSPLNAGIVSQDLADDRDGVLTCTTYGFEQIGPIDWKINIDGTHNQYAPGHVVGTIVTDGDPTLTLYNSIDNDTGFGWYAYLVNVTMAQQFTLSSISVANTGWSWSVTQAPTLVGGQWNAQIQYSGNPQVAVGETLDFGYKMTWTGTSAFCQEFVPVPEPASLGLLAIGGLLFGARKLRRRS